MLAPLDDPVSMRRSGVCGRESYIIVAVEDGARIAGGNTCEWWLPVGETQVLFADSGDSEEEREKSNASKDCRATMGIANERLRLSESEVGSKAVPEGRVL